jgi:hypothetical protein
LVLRHRFIAGGIVDLDLILLLLMHCIFNSIVGNITVLGAILDSDWLLLEWKRFDIFEFMLIVEGEIGFDIIRFCYVLVISWVILLVIDLIPLI